MTAGKIILSFKGNNNKYLCGNPNIDFWKVSFQRYTNFSMQSIELDCDDKIYPLEIKIVYIDLKYIDTQI